jgi:PiT family inorganic phosphate transporter
VENQILLFVGLVLSFFIAWNLGANDAATPCDTAVGARVITPTKAILLFSFFTAIGAIAQGHMNIKTIAQGIVPLIDPYGAITITIAAGLWSTFCTWKGLEISMTYTVVGSVIGYAMIVYGSFDLEVLVRIIISWIVSPLSSIVVAYTLYKLIRKLFNNVLEDTRFQRANSYALIGALCFSAYSFGANDVGNATGVYVAVTQNVLGLPDNTTMLVLAVLGAIGIAIGGLTWGRRVIETVAFKIVRIDALSGLAAETTNALVVYLFTTIPYFYLGYGLPVSTSIVGIGAIIGTAFARGQGIVDKRTMFRLLITWLITLPVTATISAILYTVFTYFV